MTIMTQLKRFLSRPAKKRLIAEFDSIQKRSDFFQAIIANLLENPDEILAKHAPAEGLDLYRRMESSDPTVASALATRRAAVLNRPWSILADGVDPGVTGYVVNLMADLADLPQTLEHALGAFVTGFVPLELFWTVRRGKWFVEKILARDPARYRFDRGGNLRLLTRDNSLEGTRVPPLKFIIHRHHPAPDNPYGRSILQPLYWPVTFSRAGWKWWSVAIEKYGMPIITAAFPDESTPEDRNRFAEFVQSLQAHSWSVVPQGFQIELHEAHRPSGDDYLPFLQYADTKKFQVILGQNLTAETADRGSRAQAHVHNLVRQDLTVADAAALAATINDQLIRPAVAINFNYAGPRPKFKFTPAPAHDPETLARTYDILAKHVKISERFLRETFQITD